MELRADAVIPFPREAVFAAYRDDLVKLLPFLPNVRRMEVKGRREEGPIVELVNEWHGGGEIPAAVRTFLGESLLVWTDRATWDSNALRCDWRTQTQALADAIACTGCNRFLEEPPGKTHLEVRGAVEVDGRKIRGVPGFLAGKVGRVVEEFLVSKIQANLLETAKGLQRYLEAQSRES